MPFVMRLRMEFAWRFSVWTAAVPISNFSDTSTPLPSTLAQRKSSWSIPSESARRKRPNFWCAGRREWAGNDVPIHWHGHNDFGLATAIAIAAVRGGATWIQGTINGMGERAGNADIAEVALALQCLYDVPVELKLERIREVSEFVRRAGKYELEGWKPLIGDNLFLRESGAVASQFHIPEAIEPYAADLVGAKRGIVLGKKSGLDSIRLKAEELRLDVPEVRRAAVLEAVKRKAIANAGLVSDDEFRAIVQNLADKDSSS